jgi:hypothetical protein
MVAIRYLFITLFKSFYIYGTLVAYLDQMNDDEWNAGGIEKNYPVNVPC